VVVDVKVRVTCGVSTLSFFIFLLSSSRIDCSGRGVLAGIAVRSLRVAGKGDETNLKIFVSIHYHYAVPNMQLRPAQILYTK
jgi:hypothetical protein